MNQLIVYLIFIISIIVAGIIGMIAGIVSNYLYNKRGVEWEQMYPNKIKKMAECQNIIMSNEYNIKLYYQLQDEIDKILIEMISSEDSSRVELERKLNILRQGVSDIRSSVDAYFEADRLYNQLALEKHRYCAKESKRKSKIIAEDAATTGIIAVDVSNVTKDELEEHLLLIKKLEKDRNINQNIYVSTEVASNITSDTREKIIELKRMLESQGDSNNVYIPIRSDYIKSDKD